MDGPVIEPHPFGFYHYGCLFLNSRKKLRRYRKPYNPVAYYLTCHALELFLKAYLLDQGWTEKRLRHELRHDLEGALQRAEGGGLGRTVRITPRQSKELKIASAFYSGKGFEYFAAGDDYRGLPDLRTLDGLARSLRDGLARMFDVV